MLSWVLLLGSFFLIIYTIWTFRAHGSIDPGIEDVGRLAYEKTTRLVTQGPYRFIRHPMYASLFYLAWGVFLKQINLLSTLLALIVSLTLLLTAVYEERENQKIFGEEYIEYMKRTKRFIPFVF